MHLRAPPEQGNGLSRRCVEGHCLKLNVRKRGLSWIDFTKTGLFYCAPQRWTGRCCSTVPQFFFWLELWNCSFLAWITEHVSATRTKGSENRVIFLFEGKSRDRNFLFPPPVIDFVLAKPAVWGYVMSYLSLLLIDVASLFAAYWCRISLCCLLHSPLFWGYLMVAFLEKNCKYRTSIQVSVFQVKL